MKSYLLATLVAISIAFVFGLTWYLLFTYDALRSWVQNLNSVVINFTFWKGVGIWSILYSLFFTFPITFLRNKSTEE